MARTKQTARKTQGGKKVATFQKQTRKVILEFSSDEDGDQRVPGVELGKPKRVKKRITLTLPTKPTNVTLTASFHQFFIRHGMNRALRKALESRQWTVDQMQQFQANYTAKHGTKIPPPKRYMDEEIEDADDLSEVSLMSQGDVTLAELKTLLAGISTAHKQVAEAVDLLQERVQGMTLEQVDDTAVAVSSEVANVRGLAFMTSVFDQEEMALALAVGTRRLQEWQVLMEKRQKNDITPYARLQEIFGHNARTISECAEGKKYRYTRLSVSKSQATKTVVRYQHTEYLGKPKGDEEEPGTSAETTQ